MQVMTTLAHASPVNMPDPIRKRLGYGQLWASYRPGRIVYAGSDFPHPIRFRFPKDGLDHTVQNRPGSDLDGLVRVWLNSSGPVSYTHLRAHETA